MTIDEYWNEVEEYHGITSWRFGQAAFNVLVEHRPDIAEAVRGTNADPFYIESPSLSPQRWGNFLIVLNERW